MLADLHPRWFRDRSNMVCGLSFLCPHCKKERMAVKFSPPLPIMSEDLTPFDFDDGRPIWLRQGDTFETLTLQPSINLAHLGHWHGFIVAGKMITFP